MMTEDEIQERIEELKRISRDYAGDRQIDHLCRIIVSLEEQRNALMWMLDNTSLQGTGHLVDRTLQGVVGRPESKEE